MPRKIEFDRQEALHKAMEVFWERGYEATSMQNLVESMEINRFSIYNSFGCKRELFIETLKHYYSMVVAKELYQLDEESAGLDTIEGMFLHMSDSVDCCDKPNGCLLLNTINESICHEDPIIKEAGAYYQNEFRNRFARAIQRSKNRGELCEKISVEEATFLVVSFFKGFATTAPFWKQDSLRENVKAFFRLLRKEKATFHAMIM